MELRDVLLKCFKKICNTFTLFNIQISVKRYIIQILHPISHPSAQFLCLPAKLTIVFNWFYFMHMLTRRNKNRDSYLPPALVDKSYYRYCSLLCLFRSSFFVPYSLPLYGCTIMYLSSPLLIIIGLFPEWKLTGHGIVGQTCLCCPPAPMPD